jgi:hypothetical protein
VRTGAAAPRTAKTPRSPGTACRGGAALRCSSRRGARHRQASRAVPGPRSRASRTERSCRGSASARARKSLLQACHPSRTTTWPAEIRTPNPFSKQPHLGEPGVAAAADNSGCAIQHRGSSPSAPTGECGERGGRGRETAAGADTRRVVPGGDGCGSGSDVPGSRPMGCQPHGTSSAAHRAHRRRPPRWSGVRDAELARSCLSPVSGRFSLQLRRLEQAQWLRSL